MLVTDSNHKKSDSFTYSISDSLDISWDSDPITITLDNDSQTMYYDSIATGNYDTVTINGKDSESYYAGILDDIVTFKKPTHITIGDTELTEDQVNKIKTILDMFEDDPELNKILQAQMALNKLKK